MNTESQTTNAAASSLPFATSDIELLTAQALADRRHRDDLLKRYYPGKKSPYTGSLKDERSLLIMLEMLGPTIHPIIGDMRGAYFCDPRHGQLWDALVQLQTEEEWADLLLAAGRCGVDEHFTRDLSIMADHRLPIMLGKVAAVVRDWAQVREMARHAHGAMQVVSATTNPADAIEAFARHTNVLRENLPKLESEIGSTPDKLVSQFTTAYHAPRAERLSFGFPELDARLNGGFVPSDFVFLGARPSIGKSVLALNLALRTAQTRRVIYFLLESTEEALTNRALSHLGQIDLDSIDNRTASMDDLAAATSKFTERRIIVRDKTPQTVEGVCRIVRSAKASDPFALVIVDHIGLLRTEHYFQRPMDALTEISKQLRELAKECECAVLALAQFKRIDGKPDISDLRDCGSFEQDATRILLLWRQSRDSPTAELNVAKNRDGGIEVIGLRYRGNMMTFDPAYGSAW